MEMEIIAVKTDGALYEGSPSVQQKDDQIQPSGGPSPTASQAQQQQEVPQKTKRKHRRGKPKTKNANKPYKKSNYFQMPRLYYNNNNKGGGGKGGGGGGGNNRNGGGGGGGARAKLVRSRSLVPYNTNKFLMEDHLADVPSALLTPSGRTRDSSFSVDSEDNYFFSLPEDEEEFLTKEFANVYEKARVERLENLTKQQLIEELLQIEDRYSTDQGTQRQQQLNVQRISAEFTAKIRMLEEKVRELSRENYNLRCQLMRSAAAAAASPPSAAAPTGAAEPTPMISTSEDSESDSSSSSSSSSSSASSGGGGGDADIVAAAPPARRRRSCSSRSSLSEYNAYIENNYVGNGEGGIDEEQGGAAAVAGDHERQQLLEPVAAHMDDSNSSSPKSAAPLTKMSADLADASSLLLDTDAAAVAVVSKD